MLVLGLTAAVNQVPLTIMLVRHIKNKATVKAVFRSYRFYIFSSMIFLNLLAIANYIFDMGGIPVLNSQIFVLMRIMISLCTFLIIYFVFKKASKNLENKEAYLRSVKYLFYLCMGISLILVGYMNIQFYVTMEKYSKGKDKSLPNDGDLVDKYFSLCNNPMWVIVAIVELL